VAGHVSLIVRPDRRSDPVASWGWGGIGPI